MVKKILIFFFLSYFLVLLEGSFLFHFPILNKIPLLLILTIFYNLFEKRGKNFGISLAFFSGFFEGVFSFRSISLYILIFLILAIFIKFLLKKYLQPVIHLNYGKIFKK
jgi:hypothetical protein